MLAESALGLQISENLQEGIFDDNQVLKHAYVLSFPLVDTGWITFSTIVQSFSIFHKVL